MAYKYLPPDSHKSPVLTLLLMSLNEIFLVEKILDSHFGNVCKKIQYELLKKGKLSLSQLQNSTKIPPKQLKESLFILIQHWIISWEEKSEFSNSDEKINTYYFLNSSSVFHRLLFPSILAIVEKEENPLVVESLKQTFLNGSIPGKWFLKSPEYSNCLTLLLKSGFLSPLESDFGDKKRKLDFDQIDTKRTKLHSVDVGGYVEKIQQASIAEFYKINYKTFERIFKNQKVVKYFFEKYNKSCSDLVNSIMKVYRENSFLGTITVFNLNQAIQNKLKLIDFDRKGQSFSTSDIHSLDNSPNSTFSVLLSDYLELICNDSCKIFTRKDGSISVSEKSIDTLIHHKIFQSVIRERFGKNALRIFNLLHDSSNVLDDKLVIFIYGLIF